MDETPEDKIARLQQRFRGPNFHWMGFHIDGFEDGWVVVTIPWRDEFIGNPTPPGNCQGGILATIVDTVAVIAIASQRREPCPTINLRIDYHRPCHPGTITAKGRVVHGAGAITTAEAQVFDGEGQMVASGRGGFFTPPPKKS